MPAVAHKKNRRRSPAWPTGRILLALLVVLLGVTLERHCRHYWPFLSDDALISFRYAERLTEGEGLTWTDGQRVEGYSDFLWVLLIAYLKLCGLEPIVGSRLLGFLGAYAAIIAVGIGPRQSLPSLPRLLSGGTLLALSSPLAIWSIGGLEHGFMAGVLAFGMVGLARGLEQRKLPVRSSWRPGVPFAVLALLRVDGFVLLAASMPAVAFARFPWREKFRRALAWSAPTAVALVGQLGFRYLYYGEFIPNTALVKISFNATRLQDGLAYLRDGYRPLLALVGLAAVGSAFAVLGSNRRRLVLPCSVILGWSAYVGAVGGDIFPGWRQLLFLLVPLALLVAEGADALATRWPRKAAWAILALVPTAALHLLLQLGDPGNQRGVAERWEWDGLPVAKMLERAFGSRKPLIAVDAAGAIPYWSRLPALDMLGLNDAYLPRHPPPNAGHGQIGHELGDGAYVLRRSPDLIAFNGAAGDREPAFLGGRQMFAMPEFHRRYQLLLAAGEGSRLVLGQFYLKREGGPIGIQRTADRIQVPGYFLAEDTALPPAYLDVRNQLVVAVSGRWLRRLPPVRVEPGTWIVETDPPDPALALSFRCPSGEAIRQRARTPYSIHLGVPTELGIIVGLADTRASPVELRGMVVQRRPHVEPTHTCPNAVGPVRVTLDALPSEGRENAHWRAPGHLVFGWNGVSVDLGDPRHPTEIELSVDNNDTYQASAYSSDNRLLWQQRIEPRSNGGGMAIHRFVLAEEARRAGIARLDLRAMSGDGRFSLGHLRLE